MSKIKLSDCSGCRNDFYNNRQNINGDMCWSFEDAEYEWARDVHYDRRPPHDDIKPTKRPECYNRPRYVRIKATK